MSLKIFIVIALIISLVQSQFIVFILPNVNYLTFNSNSSKCINSDSCNNIIEKIDNITCVKNNIFWKKIMCVVVMISFIFLALLSMSFVIKISMFDITKHILEIFLIETTRFLILSLIMCVALFVIEMIVAIILKIAYDFGYFRHLLTSLV